MVKKNIQINLNFVDLLVIFTILFSITGYLLAKAEKTQLNKIIEGKENIAIEVLIPDVFSGNTDLFMVGDKSAITIRNRPYTKLQIIKTNSNPKQVIIPALSSSSYKTIADSTRANVKDYTVTLTDEALVTSDGYVIGGNKIKIGNQVELEGFNYRLNGKVIDIYSLNKTQR
jgi:hypothetical protein